MATECEGMGLVGGGGPCRGGILMMMDVCLFVRKLWFGWLFAV